jgi:DNA-binding transcriptional regulator/RsmH inhibitor MraZ
VKFSISLLENKLEGRKDMQVGKTGNGVPNLTNKTSPRYRFNGYYFSKLDNKNRFCIPIRFRRTLKKLRVYLTLIPLRAHEQHSIAATRILTIYPESEWLNNLKSFSPEKKEDLLAFSFEATIEINGRIRIPSHIVNELGFKVGNALVVAGRGNYMQVWTKEEWDARPSML